MNNMEQFGFICELIDNVKTEILMKSKKFPENWDGIELRWYIADRFSQVVMGGSGERKGKRYKDFKNEVLVNNLD